MRFQAPIQVEEGVRTTQPIPGVKELNDAQKDYLYGNAGAKPLAGEEPPRARVFTPSEGRRRAAVALHQETPDKGAVKGTVNACMNSCAGAVYDFWHWNELEGGTAHKLHTVVSRGGRGPYLALSIVGFVALAFVFFLIVRGIVARGRGRRLPARFQAPSSAKTVIGPSLSPAANVVKAAFPAYQFA